MTEYIRTIECIVAPRLLLSPVSVPELEARFPTSSEQSLSEYKEGRPKRRKRKSGIDSAAALTIPASFVDRPATGKPLNPKEHGKEIPESMSMNLHERKRMHNHLEPFKMKLPLRFRIPLDRSVVNPAG